MLNKEQYLSVRLLSKVLHAWVRHWILILRFYKDDHPHLYLERIERFRPKLLFVLNMDWHISIDTEFSKKDEMSEEIILRGLILVKRAMRDNMSPKTSM